MGGKSKHFVSINTKNTRLKSKLNEKAHRKYNMGIEKEDVFANPMVEFTTEQASKLFKFFDYCKVINRCLNCQKKIDIKTLHANEDNAIVGQCLNCLYNLIDDTAMSKEWVIWINKILSDSGMSFLDGWPRYMKQEVATHYCQGCQRNHTEIHFIRVE